jgi:probable HAF family extracellular repeat protein
VLQSLNKFGSDAHGINTQGWVVGRAFVNEVDCRPVLWRDGQLTDLGLLPGVGNATAFGINTAGVVVGESWFTDDTTRGWVWADGVLADLNDLVDGLPSRAIVTSARGVDDQGRIAVTLGRWSHSENRWRTTGAVLYPVEAKH